MVSSKFRDRLRVMHLLAPGAFGGLQRVVESLALGQHRRGHDVRVVVILGPADSGHAILDRLRAAGVGVTPLVHPHRAYLRERAEIAGLCERHRPHLVHTHGYHADLIGGAAARASGTPVVTTVHGFTGGGWKNRLYEFLQRRAFRSFDRVVAVSRRQAAELAGAAVGPGRIRVVPNGWDGSLSALERLEARRALGVAGDHFRIGWAGRLSHEKGADTLVSALPRLARLPYAVSFIGAGPERPRLERITAASEFGRRVRWHGMVPDAGRYFRAFDLFVLSSRTEGMPIALFEAMAAEVPIVATAVGGVPEVVGAREALLVPPDDPEALALAIQAVHDDPHAAAVRARAAREHLMAEFGLERCIDRYESLYRELVQEYPAATARRGGHELPAAPGVREPI